MEERLSEYVILQLKSLIVMLDIIGHFYNTAIPILHSKKEGYCDTLSELFVMTRPIGFHEALKHSGEVSNQSQVKSFRLLELQLSILRLILVK